MCNTKPEDSVNIDVTISEVVLTPATCAALINEIIKYVIYQKSQIPYPYNWLQAVVNKKSENTSNISVKRHHHVVCTAYNTLEDIMCNIRREFEGATIHEVSLLFGATPYSLKEAFVVKIPRIAVGHNEGNHSHLLRKNQHKILRNIFLCHDWISAMEHSIPSTNMYVMLKKQRSADDDTNTQQDSFFLPVQHSPLLTKVRSTVVNLHCDSNRMYFCCNHLSVFEDSSEEHSTDNKSVLNSSLGEFRESEGSWYQAKVLFKGYKDCFTSRTSVSRLF